MTAVDQDPYWGHVLYNTFGASVDPLASVLELARKVHKKELSGFDIDILLKEDYTERYNFQNLNDPNKPLALVAMSPRETYSETWLHERIFQFRTYEIGKIYDCSLGEFLSYPRDVVEHILDRERENFTKIQQMKRKAEQDAKRAEGNMKQHPDQPGVFIPPYNPPPRG